MSNRYLDSIRGSGESADSKERLLCKENVIDGALFLTCKNCALAKQRRYWPVVFWSCALGIVISLLGLLFIQDLSIRGYTTFWRESEEFPPAMKRIPTTLYPVMFDAVLDVNENGTLYRPLTDPPYVGPPSPEIDAAWEDLMGPVTVFIRPDETHFLQGYKFRDYPELGLHKAFVTVFHDLHCVNLLRKARARDYYESELKIQADTLEMHLDHCLDSLRLSIMCSGDLTLMPYQTSRWGDWETPVSASLHTCRDYKALKTWAAPRDATHEDGHMDERAARLRKAAN